MELQSLKLQSFLREPARASRRALSSVLRQGLAKKQPEEIAALGRGPGGPREWRVPRKDGVVFSCHHSGIRRDRSQMNREKRLQGRAEIEG